MALKNMNAAKQVKRAEAEGHLGEEATEK